MPGNADGGLDGMALKPLTVAFHEPGFIATLQQENQQPFWFQMSDDQRQQTGNPMGPANPQALNRYAYTQNNPIRYTDPSGHWTISINFGGEIFGGQGVRGSYSLAIDTNGEIAAMVSLGGTSHINLGGSVGPTISLTNAPSVYDLQGNSVAGGVHFGELADLNLEGETFRAGPEHIQYYGGTVGASATLKGIPIDVYGAGDHTEIIAAVHPIQVLRDAYDQGVARLNQAAGVPIP